jgi:CHAD domain-containing protein
MSYRLTPHETFSDAIKRIVMEQADQAIQGLEAQSGKYDEAIHDARVCFKKIRAVLRLVRTDLGVDTFRQENICYRDAGRRLSAIRDTVAMQETLDKLTTRFADQLVANAFAELHRSLRQLSTAQRRDKKKVMRTVAKIIATAQRRVEHWPIQPDGLTALSHGVKGVYKKGKQGFAEAVAQPDVEHFHEWRKDVKYLRYQVRLIKPLWFAMLGTLGNELEKLGEYLSEDHDLALLRQHVLESEQPIDPSMTVVTLVALIDRRRAELQDTARCLGDRVYAERPGAFTRRLQVYWLAWRADESCVASSAG